MGVATNQRSRLKSRSVDYPNLYSSTSSTGSVYHSSRSQHPFGPHSSNRFPNMPALPDPKTTSAAGQGLLIGLLSAFGSAALVGIIIVIIYLFRNTSRGRIWLDRIGRPGEYDDEQALAREEAETLEQMDEISRQEYLRAKAFIEANPPDSVPTDISLSQFLAIQEKGVSAWEFEAELEIANCFVEARTEIEFYDSVCSVQSNLPVPKQNEVYYWEAKLYEKPENTLLSIGMSTKPYPMFRLPGWHKHSIAYTSSGQRRHNQPFHGTPYAPSYHQGDVIGVGYRPRTGTIFFTRNGKKLEDVAHGLKSLNLFPTVGANGPCTVHVNFGQLGFVFIEANVKKWGLAPTTGSLAPPPPYGSEQGSILLETGQRGQSPSGYFESQVPHQHGRGRSGSTLQTGLANSGRAGSSAVSPTSSGPERSPTDISLANINVSPSAHTGGNTVRQNSPPPDYTSQSSMGSSSSEDDDDSDEGSRRRSERGVERERLLRRSPTPAYRDVVSDFPPWAAGGRSRSGSAPAGPSGSGRRF